MNGKFIGIIAGVTVAIIIIGGLLMPVINVASESETESEVNPDAYGPSLEYQSNVTYPTDSQTTFIQIKGGSSTTLTIESITDNVTETIINGPRSSYPEKMILYADNNDTVYIDGNTVYFENFNKSIPLSQNGNIIVRYSNTYNTLQYGSTYQSSFSTTSNPITWFYRVTNTDDTYSNYLGDNPPAMDTPTVSIDGMYLGLRSITIEGDNPLKAIYFAIPVVLLVSLLVAVAAVAFRRDY